MGSCWGSLSYTELPFEVSLALYSCPHSFLYFTLCPYIQLYPQISLSNSHPLARVQISIKVSSILLRAQITTILWILQFAISNFRFFINFNTSTRFLVSHRHHAILHICHSLGLGCGCGLRYPHRRRCQHRSYPSILRRDPRQDHPRPSWSFCRRAPGHDRWLLGCCCPS